MASPGMDGFFRLATGSATIGDVAFSPRDVLWTAGKLSQLRAVQVEGSGGTKWVHRG